MGNKISFRPQYTYANYANARSRLWLCAFLAEELSSEYIFIFYLYFVILLLELFKNIN